MWYNNNTYSFYLRRYTTLKAEKQSRRRSIATRKRYKPGQKRPSRGRPAAPPESLKGYIQQSFSLPADGWKNLDELAKLVNALARTGSHFGQPSWRSMLHRFAMIDIPRMLEEANELGIHAEGVEPLHFAIKLLRPLHTATRRQKATSEAPKGVAPTSYLDGAIITETEGVV